MILRQNAQIDQVLRPMSVPQCSGARSAQYPRNLPNPLSTPHPPAILITMQEMSLFWLRVAAVLYSAGLIYVLDFLLRRSSVLYRPAMGAFSVAAVFHFVAIVEQSMANGHLAAQDFHQTVTLLALVLAIVFLVVNWIYDFSSLGLIAFPMVALLTTLGWSVAWS